MDGELERIEQQIGVSLAAWGTASVIGGGAIRLLGRGDRIRAFGRQSAAWGAIDLAIAAVAHLRAARRTEPLDDSDRVRLHRVLVANAVLDVGYVAAGVGVWARAEPLAASWPGGRDYTAQALRGDGAAAAVQGLFLLVHDAGFAWRTRVALGAAEERPGW